MLKRDELANPESCINKAADDEPVFVLRANDENAPAIVLEWCRESQQSLRGARVRNHRCVYLVLGCLGRRVPLASLR